MRSSTWERLRKIKQSPAFGVGAELLVSDHRLLDVFLFDRASGEIELISTRQPDERPAP